MSKLKNDLSIIRRGYSHIPELLGNHFVLLNFFQSAVSFMSPYVAIYLSGKIITMLSENDPFREIIKYAFIAVFSALILDSINRVFGKITRERVRQGSPKHDAMLSRKALTLDYGKAESSSVSELRAKVQENSKGGRGGIIWLGDHLSQLLSYILSAIVACGMITGLFSSHSDRELTGVLKFADSNLATILLFVVAFALIIISVICDSKNVRSNYVHFGSRGRLHATLDYYSEKVLNENESGKDIRIFGEKKLINEELKNRVFNPFANSEAKVYKSRLTYGVVPTVIVAIIGGLVYIFVGMKALSGALGVGKVVEYYGIITKLIQCISNITREVGLLKSNNEYLALELEYLDLQSDMENGHRSIDEIDAQHAEFEFHNVSFKYPETEPFVLENLSMKIKVGERWAVVGVNGSGKSTMIKLLCRLYDPTEGYITVNGVDIKEFDYNEYLKLFSVVFQDFKLLAFSIGENVAGNDEYDEEKVWSCLEAAGIKERIEKMPKKLEHTIYKLYERDGIDISGGEEQKIAIARALYKEAPFVILDEPTAALDPIAESEIYARFNTMVTDKTAVYISHRLSSCRFCERILVFDKGRIIEEGTHEELTALGGKYNELWTAQAQYYKN